MCKLNHILIIDDDKTSVWISRIVLDDANASETISFCQSVPEALDFLQNISSTKETAFPDLILLDVNMPCQNGFDFLDRYYELGYHKNQKAIVALYTSAKHRLHDERVKQYDVVVDTISKPLTINSLNTLLALQAAS